jgi:hypothetical protein
MQSLTDIASHVAHFAVIITRNPFCIMLVMRIELDIGNTNLLETQLKPDCFY